MAFRALGRNKMRTALTMLGVIIGVAAVICTVAIGEGASQRIQAAIENMGSNMVWIEAGGVGLNGVRTGNGTTKTLTLEDAKAIADQIPLVTHVTPNVDGHAQVVFGNQNWSTQMRGVSADYLFVKKLAVEHGTIFDQGEIDRADNVCVVGVTVSNYLFVNHEDPIGQTIRVANQPCKVIGLLEAKGQSATGQDQDDTIIMPYTTVMKKSKASVGWTIFGARRFRRRRFPRPRRRSPIYCASGTTSGPIDRTTSISGTRSSLQMRWKTRPG